MAKTKQTNGDVSDLVDLFVKASDADIASIDARIATLKKEIDAYSTPRKAEIKSLVSVKRMLNLKLHPPAKKPKKASKSPHTSRGNGTLLQDKIYDLLYKEGPLPMPAIAARLESKPGYVANAISSCNWFSSGNGQVSIATTGKRAGTPT